MRLPAGHEVEPLLELRQQVRDLGGVVLEVAVDRDDGLAAAWANPAASAVDLPKLRRRRTTLTFVVRAWSRVRAENVPSGEPSSTKIASQGSPTGWRAASSSS